MTYKILIGHKSIKNKTYWENHTVEQPDGTIVDFETDSLIELEKEVTNIDEKYGYENIRVVSDIDFNVIADIEDSIDTENIYITTSDDISDIFGTAYSRVFSDGGE